MKKLLLLFLLTLSTLHADEYFPFIGISAGYQKIDTSLPANDGNGIISIHMGGQSLKWRTVFGFEYTSDFQNLDLEVDYIPFDEPFGSAILRPYIGLNISYFLYDIDGSDDDNGYSYGINTGFLLYASDRVDIDIGYRYNKIEAFKGVDTFSGPVLSIHYFY